VFIKFNVFGKSMSVQRKDGEWVLFRESDTGVRAGEFGIAIPGYLAESELATCLADIFHESATEKYSSVTRVD
jgi:hypothetical protein